MTARFVGPGGSDAANGLSWATRKLTLAGVEATVAAGDTVYVGPGVYREQLTTGVNGSNGSPITYIGDESGRNTDGVGGQVRITGSDNDQTAVRASCIVSTKNFRTWRGFRLDGTTTHHLYLNNCTDNIVDQCAFGAQVTGQSILIDGAAQLNHVVRRCWFMAAQLTDIVITHTVTLNDTNQLIENCMLWAGANDSAVQVQRVGGVVARNCTVAGGLRGFRVGVALAAGQTFTVNNCNIIGVGIGALATTLGNLVEDYNNFYACATDRSNVNVGANSKAYIDLLSSPLLTLGVMNWQTGALDSRSPLVSIAGTGVASDDLYGTARVATSSWGAVQYVANQRPVDAGQPRGRQS